MTYIFMNRRKKGGFALAIIIIIACAQTVAKHNLNPFFAKKC